MEIITELWTCFVVQNSKHKRKNIDCKIINIATWRALKKILLDVELAIIINYYFQTATARALYESTDGPDGHPADNLPHSDGWGDFRQTVPKLTVRVN